MDAMLHRIEALPGDGGYLVTFVLVGGTEQTAVVRLRTDGVPGDDASRAAAATAGAEVEVAGEVEVEVAEASLPPGWTRTSDMFAATAAAVRAVEAARRFRPTAPALRDIPGGWDVALGNVVSDRAGARCTAHGAMLLVDGVHTCPECDARAIIG